MDGIHTFENPEKMKTFLLEWLKNVKINHVAYLQKTVKVNIFLSLKLESCLFMLDVKIGK